jgi:uncharacterized protein
MSESWIELLTTDHQTTERVLEAAQKAFAAPGGPPPSLIAQLVDYLVGYADGCHNKKEEEHLFPLIEKRGVPRQGGPLGVMLAEHDQARELIAKIKPLAGRYAEGAREGLAELGTVFAQLAELLKNHYWKENDILFPMARRVLSDEDASAVVAGFLAVEARLGPDTRKRYYAIAEQIQQIGDLKDLSYGVPPAVLAAMLNTLPVELSFVDENDKVRYFSHENGEKIFGRTRGVIGMSVQNCHPHKSVHLVNRILADFKAGKREVAEFWIDLGDKKVLIRYFPVRDPAGRYLGCLEVVQDITRIRKLEGQRRLLDDA